MDLLVFVVILLLLMAGLFIFSVLSNISCVAADHLTAKILALIGMGFGFGLLFFILVYLPEVQFSWSFRDVAIVIAAAIGIFIEAVLATNFDPPHGCD